MNEKSDSNRNRNTPSKKHSPIERIFFLWRSAGISVNVFVTFFKDPKRLTGFSPPNLPGREKNRYLLKGKVNRSHIIGLPSCRGKNEFRTGASGVTRTPGTRFRKPY